MKSQSLLPWTVESTPVAIVGDLILDEYLMGSVHRISPEAPVPVHLVTSSLAVAGGAANVARNVQLAGGKALLFGLVGADEAGTKLRQILDADKISSDQILVAKDRPTVRKTRVASGSQQIVRIDWEKVHPISDEQQQAIYAKLKAAKFQALIVSDYGKGALPAEFVQKLIKLAEERGVPSVVDPKGRDYNRYQGAFLVTPNRREACDALSLDPQEAWTKEDLAKKIQDTYKIKNVLVTLGPEGMYLCPDPKSSQKQPIFLPAQARKVFDVSGAGDTVVAVMALSLAAKQTFESAMRLANLAAGRVVEKWGTQPITRAELEEEIQGRAESRERRTTNSVDKIVDLPQLIGLVGAPGRREAKVVFTNGCFDLMHAGHVTYLEACKARGDVLVVGMNTDASVKRLKGKDRPIQEFKHRARVMAALGCVDYVVEFGEDTPAQLIEAIIPDVLIKGADYTTDKIVGADVVRAHGGSVDTVDLVPGVSTTSIIERIRN